MTISTTTSRITYNGNGVTTVFSIPFRFLANGDLVVVEVSAAGVETTKTLTTHYTLTGAGDDAGGSVTMLVAPAVGTRLIIYRDTDIVQETDYISGDPFPAETHERALDRLTMIAQEIGSDADRSIKVPVGDSSSLSTTLPASANRLDKFLVFDDVTGAAEVSTVTQTQVASAVAAAYAAGSTADAVTFLQSGTGATSRSVQSKLREMVSVLDFGAAGDGIQDDTAYIQAALDAISSTGGEIYLPRGTYKITSTLTWGNGTKIVGCGYDSLIKGESLTVPLLQSKGGSTSRRYRLHIEDLGIDNVSRAATGGIGCDLRNATDCVVRNVFFYNVDTGVQHFADGGLGCYYNTLSECVFSNCNIGAIYTTLANENRNIACRFNNTTTGILVSDGSHNHFISPSIEIFTSIGIHVSGPAYDTQIISPRLENLPTSGIGIKVVAAAVRTSIKDPQYVSLTTNLDDAGVGTTTNGRQRVTAVIDFPSIAAGAVNDQPVTISGALATDSVQVTPPATLGSGLVCIAVPSNGLHYVRMANVTSGAIDPASATFTIDIWRRD